MRKLVLAAMFTACLGGCATPYQLRTAMSMTGGYEAKQIEGNIYRVLFSANGYTTQETAQTYWLYQCASLTLEKGFQGFEILSNIKLVMQMAPEQFFAPPGTFRKVQMVYVPIYIDDSDKPYIEADILLLKAPIAEAPPKVFDAAKLKEALAPYVEGKKCSKGNVCEHAHKYLFPEGKL